MEEVFLKTKQDLKEFLECESKNYNQKRVRCPLIAIRDWDILWKHNYLLRKTEYYTNNNRKILKNLYKLRLKMFQNKYSMTIPINVFDKGLKLIHVGPRCVNDKAKVGKNCTMHINTGIVAAGTEKGGVAHIRR